MVLALLQHCAGPAEAAAPVWIGMSPLALQPQQVELFHLSSQGDRGSRVALVNLTGANETVAVNAFRCRPYGSFCLFLTSSSAGSCLYNVSVAAGNAVTRAAFPNVTLHNLHVDMADGSAYSVALAGGNVSIVRIAWDGLSYVVDLTAYVEAGARPVGSTQCSDNDSMWVSMRSSSAMLAQVTTSELPP